MGPSIMHDKRWLVLFYRVRIRVRVRVRVHIQFLFYVPCLLVFIYIALKYRTYVTNNQVGLYISRSYF